ncbi:MAG TPA: Uma2 family endonuclease [Pirellulales bacterium]|jgi:Uma2 family endonuclease|nr:Uma2 family endonuclease [Pirellulales bacterium]
MSISTFDTKALTVADLLELFGPIPAHRIATSPPPGMATEEDAVEAAERKDRHYELVQGVMLEKTMGLFESYLAGLLIGLLNDFVTKRRLGMVTGEAGMLKLAPGLIRIPDVAFISRRRLAGRRVKGVKVPELAPDLAIEVLSEGNTEREMSQKLDDYFGAGVRLVWYFDPVAETVSVYTSRHAVTVLRAGDTLGGGEVLPGFTLPLAGFFDEPDWQAPATA